MSELVLVLWQNVRIKKEGLGRTRVPGAWLGYYRVRGCLLGAEHHKDGQRVRIFLCQETPLIVSQQKKGGFGPLSTRGGAGTGSALVSAGRFGYMAGRVLQIQECGFTH